MSANIARRAFLTAMGATVIAAAGFERFQRTDAASRCRVGRNRAPAHTGAARRHRLPHHIYDHHFPVDPDAKLRPADTTVADYRLLQKRIGTSRNVVVQPSTYGADNCCMLDAMAKFGASARGVAVVDTSVSDAELKRLNNMAFAASASTWCSPAPPHRYAGAACGARAQSGLACPNPYARRPHRQDRRPVEPAPSPSYSTTWRASRAGRRGASGVRVVLSCWRRGRLGEASGAYMDSTVGSAHLCRPRRGRPRLSSALAGTLVWASDWPHPTERATAGRRRAVRPDRRLGAGRSGRTGAFSSKTRRRCTGSNSRQRAGALHIAT